MGSCTQKASRQVKEPRACEVQPTAANSRRIKNSLLDMKKVKCAPTLTLESNPRFNSRIKDYNSLRHSSIVARDSTSLSPMVELDVLRVCSQ